MCQGGIIKIFSDPFEIRARILRVGIYWLVSSYNCKGSHYNPTSTVCVSFRFETSITLTASWPISPTRWGQQCLTSDGFSRESVNHAEVTHEGWQSFCVYRRKRISLEQEEMSVESSRSGAGSMLSFGS